jgi:hypothetical protein
MRIAPAELTNCSIVLSLDYVPLLFSYLINNHTPPPSKLGAPILLRGNGIAVGKWDRCGVIIELGIIYGLQKRYIND